MVVLATLGQGHHFIVFNLVMSAGFLKKNLTIVLRASLLFGVFLIGHVSEARTYTDLQGRTLEAEVLAYRDPMLRMRLSQNGREFDLALDKLCARDRAYLQSAIDAGRLNADGYDRPKEMQVVPVIKNKQHFNASKRIDALIQKHLAAASLQQQPIVNDELYLRRAYLRVVGRIPTTDEAIDFLQDTRPNKRSVLIDTLLDSPGYVSHQFNLWADVLRAQTLKVKGSFGGGIYYVPWIKEQIQKNVPYDAFVRSLLTAEGFAWENPAVGYYMRDQNMHLDNMALGVQVFLGTQLQCAQCHDHPFEKWTQKDFYQLAAFTAGVKTTFDVSESSSSNKLSKLAKAYKDAHADAGVYQDALYQNYKRFMFPYINSVEHKEADLKFPDDYNYSNAQPGDRVRPKVPFGSIGQTPSSYSARIQSYANWMTSPENPLFTLVIANRMWKYAMGKGLIEPIDNIQSIEAADSPELLRFLEVVMRHVNYDLKQFLRVLYNTEFFQRASVVYDPQQPDDYSLQGPIFQRMSAEQLWDSIATLISPDVDQNLNGNYIGNFVYTKADSTIPPPTVSFIDNNSTKKVIEHLQSVAEFHNSFYQTKAEYSAVVRKGISSDSGQLKTLRDRYERAKARWFELFNPGSPLQATVGSHGLTGRELAVWKRKRMLESIVRASELQSPMRDGHLLEVFGQSDRIAVDNSTRKSSLTQALFLMNSAVTNKIMAEESMPVKTAALASTVEEQLDMIYLGFLSRKPTAQEFDLLIDDLRLDPENAKHKFIWAMLNTKQFLFIP